MSGKNYAHQLDAKKRMRIPAKLREDLGENYTITVGTGGCLYVYTAEQWKRVEEALSKVNPCMQEQLKAARFIQYSAFTPEEDKQGRFILEKKLINWAKIVKNIIICNGPSCIEIWGEEAYNDYFNEVDFSSIASLMSNVK